MLTVTDLITYPVKSCAGIRLSEAPVTPRGFAHDRDFMLVGDDGDFISQRKVPKLALVAPTIGGDSITLSAPGMKDIALALADRDDDERLVAATVHGTPVTGQLVGEELDEWFTTFLPPYRDNRRFRLLRVRADVPRSITARYHKPGATNIVGFADGNSLLLATEPSLRRLNTQLEEPVPMSRFRPNIVVDGDGLAPYDEDYWTVVHIGAMTAFVVKGCDRCAIPDTDQATAIVGKEVRGALRTRRGVNTHDAKNTGVFFGQNLNHLFRPGLVVRLGDPVEVAARAAAPNVLIARA